MVVYEKSAQHHHFKLASSLNGTHDVKGKRRDQPTGRQSDDDDTRDDVSDATDDVRSKRVLRGTTSSVGTPALSPFQFACRHGCIYIVTHLIKGTNIHVRDSLGNTPLQDACSRGHLEIVKLLLQHGALVDSCNDSGNTALHDACWKGHFGMMRYLVRNGHASIDIRNNNGQTPLQLAKLTGRHKIVKYLGKCKGDGSTEKASEYLDVKQKNASSVMGSNHLEKKERDISRIRVILPRKKEQDTSTTAEERYEAAVLPLDESAYAATMVEYPSSARKHDKVRVSALRATTPARNFENRQSRTNHDKPRVSPPRATTPTRRSSNVRPGAASPKSLIRRSPLPVASMPRATTTRSRRSANATREKSPRASSPNSPSSAEKTRRLEKLPLETSKRSMGDPVARLASASPQLRRKNSKAETLTVISLPFSRKTRKSIRRNISLQESSTKAKVMSMEMPETITRTTSLPAANRIGISPNPRTIETLKSSMVMRIEKLENVVGIKRQGRDGMLRRLSELDIAVFGSVRNESVSKRLSHMEHLLL